MKQLNISSLILFMLISFTTAKIAQAQTGPPNHVKKAIEAIEQMVTSDSASAVSSFIDQSLIPSDKTDRNDFIDRLENIKAEIQDRWKNVAIRPDPDGIRLIFSEQEPTRHLKVILDQKGIYDLYFVDPPEPITFTENNIDSVFNQLEEKGLSGVAYFKVNGKEVYRKGFGMANKNRNILNDPNTIFGIGSRPIDFTRAAIQLLKQQGHISPDDTIGLYFEEVPKDKQKITIHHLMTGQSGLPDFFDTIEDWDPDLAWVDKETAINRMMEQNLLFTPGSDRRHSHGAFGLLAALIEEVSGQTYFQYLNENFFLPAGIRHTNEYGIADDHSLSDFAVGYGPQSVGLPNIPPNWGPTSWLVKGSGGMYSTLGDLLKFYDFIRTGDVLNLEHKKIFEQPSVNLDGSVRGFELFSAYNPNGNETYIFLNDKGDAWQMRTLFDAAEQLVMEIKN